LERVIQARANDRRFDLGQIVFTCGDGCHLVDNGTRTRSVADIIQKPLLTLVV
jgi:hypothetical protein